MIFVVNPKSSTKTFGVHYMITHLLAYLAFMASLILASSSSASSGLSGVPTRGLRPVRRGVASIQGHLLSGEPFESLYNETKEVEVELFTWEKLNRTEALRAAFGHAWW